MRSGPLSSLSVAAPTDTGSEESEEAVEHEERPLRSRPVAAPTDAGSEESEAVEQANRPMLEMLVPKLGIFTMSLFRRRVEQFNRGQIATREFVQMYLDAFDPDTVAETLPLLPDEIHETIRTLLQQSPASEQDWADIAVEQQRRADSMRKKVGCRGGSHLENWIMHDHDGAWRLDAFDVELQRAAVYALREAFQFPCHEEPWTVWRACREDEIRRCDFHPWQIENRCHWYRFLAGGSFSPGGLNPFTNHPSRLGTHESTKLHEEFFWGETTLEQLKNRHDFILREYPLYFFNIRRTLRGILDSRQFALSQVDRLRSFAAARPDRYAQLIIRESKYSQADVTGTVPNAEALEDLRRFTEESFSREMWARFDDAAPDRLLTMLESVTINEMGGL